VVIPLFSSPIDSRQNTERILAMPKQISRQSSHMHRFSTLSGPWNTLPKAMSFKVAFTEANIYDSWLYRVWTKVVAYGSLCLVLVFATILFQPSHWIVVTQPNSAQHPENWLMLICLAVLQIFLIIGTYAATRSTIKAKNPIPIRYPSHFKIAFCTTRAPGEPINMVRNTLEAAKRLRHKNINLDIWLLDETNDNRLKNLCKELDVHYFSRFGVKRWNQTPQKNDRLVKRFFTLRWLPFRRRKYKQHAKASYDPFYAAKTKHGNYNSWRQHLKEQGYQYDILTAVDTDHVPEPNYLERMLGYFRDPDVGFVVGPQVYGNYSGGLNGLVVRWAESQASFFQSTVQRAGNATTSSMFVGTNYAVRMETLNQIGGFQPCITEDMATGLAIHSSRNPRTNNRWKSVYTPDVLAVGEGPDFWAPYFTQQWRWAAGTFDTWRRQVPKVFFKLPPRAMLHYFLMLTFYPITALTWLLGIVSSVTYLLTGATAIIAPWNEFLALYLMSLVMQLSLYFWNRRINVSPFDKEGTYGVPGMALTSLTAPIYLSALIGIAFGKKPKFVVTKKGGGFATDKLSTFKAHLSWAALLLTSIVFAVVHHHTHPAMLIWVGMQLVICMMPALLALSTAWSQGAFRLRVTPARRYIDRREATNHV
jgi:cellulose synthase/poly-beta-1,6-N-acetylglucosamine synthase-like glycosyltransferase